MEPRKLVTVSELTITEECADYFAAPASASTLITDWPPPVDSFCPVC
jgi:hypothetical protein